MGINRPSNVGQNDFTGTAGRTFTGTWAGDTSYWREEFRNRPYATADRRFEDYEPGYRYAYEMEPRFHGRKWDEVEGDLRSGWDRWEGRGQSTWENIKEAARDAWDKLTGREHTHDTR